jgi:hypothetical protein
VSALERTQKWLVDAITAPSESPDVESYVTPSAKQTPRDRLHVYRHAYVARLIECLEDDYPVVFHALGRDRAEALCRQYIEAHPSRSFSLNVFGQSMPAFLRAKNELFAADLAALEWSVVEAIHAAESVKMAPDALAKIDPSEWGKVALVASASLRLHQFDYPVNAYYQAFHDDEDPAIPEPVSERVAIFRRDMKIWRMALSPGQYALLGPLVRGASLEEAFESDVGEEADVGAWFQQWTAEGFFSGTRSR